MGVMLRVALLQSHRATEQGLPGATLPRRASQSPAELFGSLYFRITLQPTWPAIPKRSETHFPPVCDTTFL